MKIIFIITFFFASLCSGSAEEFPITQAAFDGTKVAGQLLIPKSFSMTTEEADRLKKYALTQQKADGITPCVVENNKKDQQCRVVSKTSDRKNAYTLFIEIDSPIKVKEDQFDGISTLTAFQKAVLYNPNGNSILQYYPISNLILQYQKLNPLSPFPLDAIQGASILHDFLLNQSGVDIQSSKILMDLAKQNMINSPQNWNQILSSVKDYLSTEEKYYLVSNFGNDFAKHYNTDRSNGIGARATGMVSITDLLDSVRTNTPGGICRDVALAQVQMLKQLGIKQSYVISYGVYDGFHTSIMSRNPDTGKTIQFNYGEVYHGNASAPVGTNADFSLGYTVFDADGKPVKKLDSALGALIKDATGNKPSYVFGLPEYSINRIAFRLPNGDEGAIAQGQTSSGENVKVIAYTKKVFKSLTATAAHFESDATKIFQNTIQIGNYLSLNAKAQSDFVLGNQAVLSPNAEVTASVSQSNIRQGNFSGSFVSKATDTIVPHEDFSGVAGLDLRLPDKSHYRISTNLFHSVTNVSSSDQKIIAVDGIELSGGSQKKISSSETILFDATAAFRTYGQSVALMGSYLDQTEKVMVRASAATPISNDMPEFFPEGRKKITVDASKVDPQTGILFTIGLKRNITDNQNQVTLNAQIPVGK